MIALLFIFSVFIASVSQILLKIGSSNKNVYINKYTIIGYAILVISTLCTVLAYRKINLSTGVILESLSYVFVSVLSLLVLKEKLNRNKIIGIVIIIIGIIIFNL